jgi:hypothetical protein
MLTDSSPVAIFVLSLVLLQVNASIPSGVDSSPSPSPEVFTIRNDHASNLGKRARKADYEAHPAGELVCRPFGLCEPCPADEVSLNLDITTSIITAMGMQWRSLDLGAINPGA